LGLRHRAPFIYNVQELYPDIAVSLGVVRNRPFIWLMYRLERFVYSTAGRVTVISEPMRDRILGKGVPAETVVHIPNWVDTSDITVLSKDNTFSRAHGVESEFVVCYAGNMGLAQSFAEFISAAVILRDTPNIRFMLIGDGVERSNIVNEVEGNQLDNVIVLPYQPYHLVPLIYAATDLSYVPLHGAAAAHALPSKVYRIMASGRTALALAGPDSGIADLIRQSGSGILVEPGSGDRLAAEILKAALDPGKVAAMGRSGREFVVDNYSRNKIVDLYADVIADLAGPERR
jgi:colanic acid biosynthesis glycosyl transferase WcaI